MLLRTLALQLLLIVPALAQFVEPSADGKSSTVTLPLLILEKNKPAPEQGMGIGDLQISEDGVQRELKTVEQRKTSDRLLVAVLLDCSNSQRAQFEAIKRIAQLAIEKLVRDNVDAVAVGVFNSDLKHTNFVTDKKAAVATLTAVRSGGGTAVYDAIYEFTRRLTDPAIRRNNVTLVLISDGDDNQSQHTLDDAIREAQKSNVTVFGIDTGLRPGSITAEKGHRALVRMIQETGGMMLDGYSEKDFSSWLDRLAPALQNRTYATYQAVNDAERKRIEVRTSKKKVKIVAAQHRDSALVAK